MNAVPAFASSGARTEHRPAGPSRMRISLGRVLRARLATIRSSRPSMTHETARIQREEARARDAQRVSTERARVLIARQVL
ncbi:hypothetical protein SAMN04515691_2709 [Leifsonia sp. 98AMF]|uniref:hypothetical protein n=1 Tax=unclassified Leifsonia TaxID=2663824 RepID=UPI00087C779C|nr:MULTISPECIES: hypothetical protein [unclassified Leifsonia]SDH21869.1 hypothetical protein SAMN04515690_1307 [Leifsonia sp. 197AMF]SDJ16668.1 hypothetical protein SAMN04515684_2475 [Leifsonia sp. 466MF]SDJ50805.1 hypothetical protein SAMN04515683_0268 [Leifsonia sp. 157MF]SDN38141.1 hypothetical protein SAMN04515686_0659 [Leifsonia sp. 509MF]SEM83111.1 hypothetical protein SAMN04515685_0256 [Leifsonia sp. 467MF]